MVSQQRPHANLHHQEIFIITDLLLSSPHVNGSYFGDVILPSVDVVVAVIGAVVLAEEDLVELLVFFYTTSSCTLVTVFTHG